MRFADIFWRESQVYEEKNDFFIAVKVSAMFKNTFL
ncbi:hypothetical protein DJ93_4361 [Bacillus clarus]|uniref:Uncharacterized protein n=1 Tax=Bacillus clarus TaxID=2338372 RepID=A0A090ZAM3_9BACI|nr:hypothetical protein DJ93_4361 [Bacillus clarus]